MRTRFLYRAGFWAVCLALSLAGMAGARGEAMLQLFQMKWADLSQKMPELAEAGYTSLWLPQPAKASGSSSVGYDIFDPFDLGDQNQNGSIATLYGTKADLLQMVQTAHRFGIRVYFDNVMNHRQGVVPGYDVYTPTNYFPGLWPQDFHLQTTSSGNRNWPNVQDWNNVWDVENEPINSLCDLATEPGPLNFNFGPTLGSTTSKPVFIRQPTHPEYYMDTNTALLGSWPSGGISANNASYSWSGGSWHGFNGTHGQPVPERVEDYLTRAAMWTLYTTKCDGFRLDAVKHVPSPFFGDYSTSWRGYVGGIQAMFDFTHGYGNNVLTNGFVEADDNRNSCFDTETARNDAMLFGEHLGPPPSYGEYISTGMRLLNSPLRTVLNGALQGNGSLPSGMDQRDFIPYDGAFSAAQAVQFAEDQDHILCCPTHREMQNVYYFMHEGLPMIYSDNFNWAGNPTDPNTFPEVPLTDYLGQYGDNAMPELCYIHGQTARGGTRPRWTDSQIVAFERYDYRDVQSADPLNDPDATVVLFAMNATYNTISGDVLFDDAVVRTGDGYYNCFNSSPSRGVGMVVGFPPGSVLSQMASTSPNGGNSRTCAKLLVHGATASSTDAYNSRNAADPTQRLIYVGSQTLAPGGGAVELLVPAGGWVMYAYQGPEPSRVNVLTNAVTFRQGGGVPPMIATYRHDGTNGDPDFGPSYPFKARGGVDASGNPVLYAGEGHVSGMNNTYAIQIPILTNAPFDIVVRSDASAVNALVKMDGGLDLNSQMLLGPTNGFDRRDNRPGYVSDVWLGYEQALWQLRNGPEKFAARDVSRNNVTSLGAETYYYTVGGTNGPIINGSGNGATINTETATNVLHDPALTTTVTGQPSVNMRNPLNVGSGQAADVWVKVWIRLLINQCYLYYTTDGTNPEGAFGVGRGTTQVIAGSWINADTVNTNIDWWKVTIPALPAGTQVRYKVALFNNYVVPPISDADNSKLYGLTEFDITNFNPTTATVWLHNDLNTNSTATGLASGFHIIRGRCFLPRDGKSAVYSTFSQTFYYDGQLPGGTIVCPSNGGGTLTNTTYQVVVRTDSSVTGVEVNIQDSDPSNDDATTGQSNGNGLTNGVPVYVSATPATPDPTLSQQYPNYPQEFHFTYVAVPSSGAATINVRLKTFSTAVFPGRFTPLTCAVNTLAPAQVLFISAPSTDGQPLILGSNDVYTITSCFTSTLTPNNYNLFSIFINGVLQPRQDGQGNVLYHISPLGCGTGLRQLSYDWTGFSPGTNVIQVNFTNGLSLNATRTVPVGILYSSLDSDGDGVPDWLELLAGTNPYDANSFFHITSLVIGNPVELLWSSVPNKTYQILATTNLNYPMAPLPDALVTADPSNTVTHWFDLAPDATNRFYRIQVLP